MPKEINTIEKEDTLHEIVLFDILNAERGSEGSGQTSFTSHG